MRILVPLDESDLSRSALPKATELARALGQDLLLVTVADAHTRSDLAELASVERADPIDILNENLISVADSISGIEVVTDLMPGDDPASVIVDRAEKPDVSMIVMATHGRTGLSRWRMGSVADRVVRGATVPVLVVPAPWRLKVTEPTDIAEQAGV
ncbi:MAG: universal stress protein [Acidimicrobiia bacterium]